MESKQIDYEKTKEKEKKSIFKKMFNFFTLGDGNSNSNLASLPNDKTMWVPDEKAPTCYNCQKQFSAIFLRKHHCRICGNVFCKDCSSKTVEGKYWGSKKEIKVCDYCHEMYKKLDETLVETTIDNTHNFIEDIDNIEDNVKNLKRETKLSEYCKKNKKENEECLKFLQMDKKYEDNVRQNLDNYYEQLVKHYIEVILRNENLYDKWFDRLFELTKKTISQINPSFKDLKDSMNINEYIKIKTIPYKDQSLCKVIDGYAFQKNVATKTMNTNIENPKILLLDCGLDYNRNKDNITNFENLMTLEPAYFNIIMKKIELVEPTVILVNKNVSRKIQENLAISNKISLVMNVKSSSLKKISRCTKTYVLPSTDLIDGQTILGTCKKFRIEKIKTSKVVSKDDILKSNEFNLMVFEGCDYVLYATIILSGPDLAELKLIKKLMRNILLTVRDLFLQKNFLYFSYCDYPDVTNVNNANEINTNNDMISRVSISSSKNSCISGISFSNNSQLLFIHKHIPNMNPSPHQLYNNLMSDTNNIKDFLNGFDTCIFYEKSRNLNVVKMTISQGNATNSVGFFYNQDKEKNQQLLPGAFNGNHAYQQSHEPAETEVLKKVNFLCSEPEDLELIFYSDLETCDKPLGKLIIDLCNEADTKCDCCRKLKSSHIYYIFKKLGRLKIELIQNSNDSFDNLEKITDLINRESTEFTKYNNFSKNQNYHNDTNYNIDIYSYGVCKICQTVVTPLVKLPREVFNFSVAMFFKFMLFNHDLRNRSDRREFNLSKQYLASNECKHFVNRDIYRIFVTKIGTVKFSYEDSPIYIIESSHMNEKSDIKYFSDILENYCRITRDKSSEVLTSLINNFKFYNEHIYEISNFVQNNLHPSSTQVSILDSIEKLKVIINRYIQVSNEISNFVDTLFGLSFRFEDYTKAIVYIKRVYFRIVQVKIVQNHLIKIVLKIKSLINKIQRSKIYNALDKSDRDISNISSPNTISNFSPSVSINLLSMDIINIEGSFMYDNLDYNDSYKSILKEISFFDENHTKFSSDNSEEDLSSIIAFTLTSDKYRDFISPSNRFKLIEIKCERKSKSQFDCWQFFRDNMKKEIKDIYDNHSHKNGEENQNPENKYGYNFFTTQDEEVQDTCLLFDHSKNTYQYPNLDNHKIYQQLETELLSDEKSNFSYTTSNSNIMNYLMTWNLPIEFTVNKKKNESHFDKKENIHSEISKTGTGNSFTVNMILKSNKETSQAEGTNTSSNIPHNNTPEKIYQEPIEEKLILQGDKIKEVMEEMDQIFKEISLIKESVIMPTNENKPNTKSKKNEFIEDSILTSIDYEVIAYYPRQFEALRITYCATYDEFILSVNILLNLDSKIFSLEQLYRWQI
jgi:hypothetical protein